MDRNIYKDSINFDKKFEKKNNEKIDRNLNQILLEKNTKFSKILKNKLNEYIILFDEGIKLVGQIQKLCENNYLKNEKGMTFLVLSSKIFSNLLGIRKLLFSGLPDCTKILKRPLIESIDIFFACLINKELSDKFSNKNELYDSNEFYWKNFSKKKLPKEYNKFFKALFIDEDYIKFLNERRKNQRKFLSESIHSSFTSSFANYVMCDINFEFKNDPYGKITTGYPKSLMNLIEDIYIFSHLFDLTLRKNLCSDFDKLKIHHIDLTYIHYQKKFLFLYTKYHKKLLAKTDEYINFFKEAEERLKKRNDA